jgi:hypothetical protein
MISQHVSKGLQNNGARPLRSIKRDVCASEPSLDDCHTVLGESTCSEPGSSSVTSSSTFSGDSQHGLLAARGTTLTCLVRANVGYTAHGFARIQVADKVLVIKHLACRVRE